MYGTHAGEVQKNGLDAEEKLEPGNAWEQSLAMNTQVDCSVPSTIEPILSGAATETGRPYTSGPVVGQPVTLEETSASKSGKEGPDQQVRSLTSSLEETSTQSQGAGIYTVKPIIERERMSEENLIVDDCPTRSRAPLRLWTVNETAEKDLLYTQGLSTFVEAFNGQVDILMMMLDQNLMANIKKSVIAGQRFRELKKVADLVQHDTRLERAHHLQVWRDMDNMDALMQVRPSGTKNNQGVSFELLASEFCRRRKEASDAITIIDKRVERAKDAAIEAEKVWMEAMRLVDWEHQRLFRDAGAININAEYWKQEDCVFKDRVHQVHNVAEQISRDNIAMDRSQQQCATPYNQEPLPSARRSFNNIPDCHITADKRGSPRVTFLRTGNKDTEANLQQAYNDILKHHRDREKSCRDAVSEAIFQHEQHRDRYYDLLSQYAADHSDLEGDALLQAFGPVFLREGQRRIQILDRAEERLRQTRKKAQMELDENSVVGKWEDRQERERIESVQRMDDDISKSFDRDKIERWLANLPREMDLAYNTAKERPDFWQQERLRHRSGSNPLDQAFDGQYSEPPASPVEDEHWLEVPLHKRRALIEGGRPRLTDHKQPRVDDVLGLDSISMLDVRHREAIDEHAWEFRDGYY